MPSLADTSSPSRRVATVASLLALACVLGMVEALLVPPLPVPGLKLGVANVAVVVALTVLDPRDALAISIGRVLIVGIATGTLFGPVGAMSAAGAIASWALMSLLAGAGPRFSPIGWSVAGAAASVTAQLIAASATIGSPSPLMLMPVSLGLSLPSGIVVGLLSRLLISRISREVTPAIA